MTTSAYKPLTTAEKIFYEVVWKPLLKAGEVALAGVEASVPVLDLPIVQGLEDDVIDAVADAVFKRIVLFIDVTAIKLTNPVLQSKWASASESLPLIAQEQGESSDAYKQALSTAATDFARWVRTGP